MRGSQGTGGRGAGRCLALRTGLVNLLGPEVRPGPPGICQTGGQVGEGADSAWGPCGARWKQLLCFQDTRLGRRPPGQKATSHLDWAGKPTSGPNPENSTALGGGDPTPPGWPNGHERAAGLPWDSVSPPGKGGAE